MEEILEMNPENPKSNYLMGIAKLFAAGSNPLHSLSYFTKAYDSGLPFPHIDYYMGRGLHLNNEFEKAIKFYNKEYLMAKPDAELDYDTESSHFDVIVSKEKISQLIENCQNGILLSKSKGHEMISNMAALNTHSPDMSPVLSEDESVILFTAQSKKRTKFNVDLTTNLPDQDIYMSRKDENGNWSTASPFSKINTNDHDAAVSLSNRDQTLYLYREEATHKLHSGSIYKMEAENGKWSKPERLPEGINTDYWETHITMSQDGKSMVIVSDREGGEGKRDLYYIRKLPNGEWANPQNLGAEINTELDEESPFLTDNGETLYFSSKGHNSIGGFDIYKAKKDPDTGLFTAPINMGIPTNSASDDVFYIVSKDGSHAYFSSIREDTKGSFDIYSSTLPEDENHVATIRGVVMDKETLQPMNAEIRIIDLKTHQQVFDIYSSAETGHYSATLLPNRAYAINVLHKDYLMKSYHLNAMELFEDIEIVHDFSMQPIADQRFEPLNNVFLDERTSDVLEVSEPELRNLIDFLEQNPNIVVQIGTHLAPKRSDDDNLTLVKTKAKTASVNVRLKELGIDLERFQERHLGFGKDHIALGEQQRIEYFVKDLTKKEEPIVYPNLPESEDIYAIMPDCLEKGKKQKLEERIVFSEMDHALTSSDKVAINRVLAMLMECSEMELQIVGHTNVDGGETLKDALKLKSANTVAQYFILQGIAKERLHVIADKESPIELNGKNWIDFFALGGGSYRENPLEEPKLMVSNSSDFIAEDLEEDIAARGESTGIKASAMGSAEKLEKAVKVYRHGEFIGISIYFDFDSDKIKESEKKAITTLVKILENDPLMKMEVIGHTDNVGSDNYNEKLGKKRAKSVEQFLLLKAVDKDRIIIKSMGEGQPVMGNETSEGRQKNRRTEFKVVKETDLQ
ncbi:OmpA family protein [Sediminitomix flava]|nr:OmpA family protein [Sediminitomix flava]